MPIYVADLSDALLAEVLAGEFMYALQDRFSLMGHPAVRYVGNASRWGSTTIKVPLVGTRRMQAVAENASATDSALVTDSYTITIGRQALQSSKSDLSELIDNVGLTVDAFVVEMITAAAMRWMEMLCAEGDGFTNVEGTTGTAMSVDTFLASRFHLIHNGVAGPHIACMYPDQVTQLLSSLRSETSAAFTRREDAQDLFAANGQGIMGNLLGVDIVSSSMVQAANAGADSAGFICGYGAIAYADGTAREIRGAADVVYPAGQPLYVEFERNASGALTKVVGNYFVGMKLGEDARGSVLLSERTI